MRLIVGLIVLCSTFLEGRTLEEKRDFVFYGVEGIIESVDPTALVGVKIVSLDSGEVLYERNGERRFVPASALKILTMGAAFAWLGKDDCFVTEVRGDGPIEGGRLKGNLYLVGSGDPSLTALDLMELVEGLKIQEIEGDVVLDRSCFEDAPMGPGWMWDEEPAYWSVLMDGLNVEHNFAKGWVVHEPALLTATLFSALLERRGIKVKGVREGSAPRGGVLSSHVSEPISALAKVVLRESDNLYADCIFKKMGGSWEKGRERVETFLAKEVGLDPKELVMVDGSGLSRYNLISPSQMIEVLKKMRGCIEFQRALPLDRVKGVIAKSGTMTGVSSLCGYVRGEEEYAVAIFVNGYVKEGKEIKKRLEDEVCRLLVQLD